jgi:hypothetical protein
MWSSRACELHAVEVPNWGSARTSQIVGIHFSIIDIGSIHGHTLNMYQSVRALEYSSGGVYDHLLIHRFCTGYNLVHQAGNILHLCITPEAVMAIQ